MRPTPCGSRWLTTVQLDHLCATEACAGAGMPRATTAKQAEAATVFKVGMGSFVEVGVGTFVRGSVVACPTNCELRAHDDGCRRC